MLYILSLSRGEIIMMRVLIFLCSFAFIGQASALENLDQDQQSVDESTSEFSPEKEHDATPFASETDDNSNSSFYTDNDEPDEKNEVPILD